MCTDQLTDCCQCPETAFAYDFPLVRPEQTETWMGLHDLVQPGQITSDVVPLVLGGYSPVWGRKQSE